MVGKKNNTDPVATDGQSVLADSTSAAARSDPAMGTRAIGSDVATEHPSAVDAASAAPLLLGQINGVFGVKGWCKVFSDTEPRDNILSYRRWLLRPKAGQSDAAWREVKVLDGRRQGKTIVVQLEGVNTPEAALALSGSQIAIMRSQLPVLAADEFYWSDLVGLDVVSVHNLVDAAAAGLPTERLADLVTEPEAVKLGTVNRLFPTGANDVLVVVPPGQSATAKNEILIPWVMGSVILKVDLEQGVVVVDWDPDY